MLKLLSFILPVLLLSAVAVAQEPNPHAFAINKLMAENFSADFVQLVSANQDDEVRDRIAKLNMLGFMLKGDYSVHYSPLAIKRVRKFILDNKTVLARAEKQYGVPKEVIASLLWVETKYGKLLGRYNIASVFFYILQLDHPDVIEMNYRAGQSIRPNDITDAEMKAKIISRAKTKTAWALGELHALYKMYQKSPQKVSNLRGSFGGAFGNSQFLPSSYLRWGASSNKARSPDLLLMNDAIFSVGNYLHSNGWKKTVPASQKAALFHYNRSEGYVNVILKIAKELNPKL